MLTVVSIESLDQKFCATHLGDVTYYRRLQNRLPWSPRESPTLIIN
jgi:hypothetical protein